MQETLVLFLGWEDPWRREWLPTPVFGPEEFHGLFSPLGRRESDGLNNFHVDAVMDFEKKN